ARLARCRTVISPKSQHFAGNYSVAVAIAEIAHLWHYRHAVAHKFVIGAVEQCNSVEVSTACRDADIIQLGKTPFNRRNTMHNMRNIGAILAVAGLFSFPLTVQAQGIPEGAARGAQTGGDAAGPLGAAVGGVVGGVTGGVAGLLGVDQRPRFREYVVREH